MKINYCLFLFLFLFSCSSETEKKNKENTSTSKEIENNTDDEKNSENGATNDNGCKYENGTYSATVDYNNSETGYSQTYTLDVEIEDCQVVQINFPNDGYLDSDHISPANLDENGSTSIDGEGGKTYEIQIE